MLIYADLVVTTSSGYLLHTRRQVLYFVNIIKISISFTTSVLVISHSVTFLFGYNRSIDGTLTGTTTQLE